MVEGYRVKAVLFDFDGILTRPGGPWICDALRRELGCPVGEPVLKCIQGIEEDAQRRFSAAQLVAEAQYRRLP